MRIGILVVAVNIQLSPSHLPWMSKGVSNLAYLKPSTSFHSLRGLRSAICRVTKARKQPCLSSPQSSTPSAAPVLLLPIAPFRQPASLTIRTASLRVTASLMLTVAQPPSQSPCCPPLSRLVPIHPLNNIQSKGLKVRVLVAQSRLTLCDPMDCSRPGSSVHGILQARILEWVAIPFSRGSSQPKDQTHISYIEGRFFII